MAVGAACMLASGCSFQSVGKSLGRGAAQGGVGYLEDPHTQERVHGVSDSLLAGIAVSVRTRLRPVLDSTVAATLEQGHRSIRRAQDSLVVAIRGDLSGALSDLVRTNVASAGVAGRAQLDLTTKQLALDVEQNLTPVLQHSVVASTRALMDEFSVGLKTRLAAAAESAVAGAVTAGVRAGSKGVGGSPVWKTAIWIGVGTIGSIVFLGVAWLVRERRRSLAALDVVANGINRRGDEVLKGEIKSEATARGVEGWLHEYLARKGHL